MILPSRGMVWLSERVTRESIVNISSLDNAMLTRKTIWNIDTIIEKQLLSNGWVMTRCIIFVLVFILYSTVLTRSSEYVNNHFIVVFEENVNMFFLFIFLSFLKIHDKSLEYFILAPPAERNLPEYTLHVTFKREILIIHNCHQSVFCSFHKATFEPLVFF